VYAVSNKDHVFSGTSRLSDDFFGDPICQHRLADLPDHLRDSEVEVHLLIIATPKVVDVHVVFDDEVFGIDL